MQAIRSVVAILVGLAAISLLVEPLEFALVALVNGGIETDPAAYLAVRNQPWFLALKLAYNFGGGLAGGYLAAWLAPREPAAHGFALAILQGMILLWAMSDPELGSTAPVWAWLGVALTTGAGIIGGAAQRAARTPAD